MDWLRYKKIYFIVSVFMVGISVYALTTWGLELGLDFTGGSNAEYRFETAISEADVTNKLNEAGVDVSSVQSTQNNSYLFKFPPLDTEKRQKVKEVLNEISQESVEEMRFEIVGPSVGPELIKKTIYAIAVAAFAILLWVAYQFKSLKFGASAIIAMFHDSFILIGAFSLLGRFFGAEVDFLFVTALLTTLSFSVHDTIVVFDRIREISKTSADNDVGVANHALSETMVRSLNNSFTIIFMLVALLLLGGTTIRWFAGALLIGTVLGTYSSPFVAVPLLVTWDKIISKSSIVKDKIKLLKRN